MSEPSGAAGKPSVVTDNPGKAEAKTGPNGQAPAAPLPAVPESPETPEEEMNDDEFWDRDDGGFTDQVKEDALQNRASDTNKADTSQYRELNKMMVADHSVVEMPKTPAATATGTASSLPQPSDVSVRTPSGNLLASPLSPTPPATAQVAKGTATRSQTLLVTASIQPNVSSKESVTDMRRGSVASTAGSVKSPAALARSPTTGPKKPSSVGEARTAPNVGEVKDSFQWLDEDLQAEDPLDWDHVDTTCSKFFGWWRRLPRLYQYLLYNAIGITILMTPGIIDIMFFIENPQAYWANFIPKTDANGNPYMVLGGYVIFIWSLWSAITLFVATTLTYLIPYFPYVMLRTTYLLMGTITDDFTQAIVQFSRVLNVYIVWFFSAVISALTFGQMMPNAVDTGATVSSLLSSTVGISLLWLMVKLGLAIFGRNFQRRIFQKRLEVNRFRIYVLEKLYQGITLHLDRTPEPENAPPKHTFSLHTLGTLGRNTGGKVPGLFTVAASTEAAAVESTVSGTAAPGPVIDNSLGPVGTVDTPPTAALPTDLPAPLPAPLSAEPHAAANGTSDPTDKHNNTWLKEKWQEALQVVLVGGEQITEAAADESTRGVPLGNLKEAKMLARDLYVGLMDVSAHQEADARKKEALEDDSAVPSKSAADPAAKAVREVSKNHITIEQFKPFFASEGLARQSFEIFDSDFRGTISRQEMKDTVLDIYNTRVTLGKSMKDSLAAIGKLDGLVGGIAWTITVLVYAGTFIDVSMYVAGFAAFWAGFAFAFQKTITNIVESIIFLFSTHPFDVGDRVMFEGETYFVKELGLMSTVLTHVDGREMYASNPVLSQKEIYNVMRSGGQSEIIDMRVSIRTTTKQLTDLANMLNAAIKDKYMKDFFPNITCDVTRVDFEQETMTVDISLDHRSNFQSGRARWIRSTNFAKLLRQCVAEIGLEGGKMELINLVGVSEWFAAVMGSQGRQGTAPEDLRASKRILPEGFQDKGIPAAPAPAITVDSPAEEVDDYDEDEEEVARETERRTRMGE